MKRLFIGVPVVSPNTAAQTMEWQNDPELNLNRLAWTRPSNWHITLVFLGATQETAVTLLCKMMDEAFGLCPAYSAALTGSGVFPSLRRPNVLWLGLDNIRPLLPYYEKLILLLLDNKFPFDPKPLKPHLTIARVKSLHNRSSLDQLLQAHHNTSFGEVTINRIVLYESTSSSNGVIYKPLYEKKLTGE